MIPFNAVLAEEYWEPLLALPSEQRQVADRELLSEQRSEGQPGYLGGSLLHLHRHQGPITATPPTDTATLPMDIPLTDIRVTNSLAMGTPAIRDTPLAPQVTDTQAIRGIPLIPGLRVMDTPATRDTRLILGLPVMDTATTRGIRLIPGPRAMDTATTRGVPPIPGLRVMDTATTRGIRLIPGLRAMDTPATRDTRRIPGLQAMDTSAARHTLPPMGTQAIALWKIGLGPTTSSSLLAEVLPKISSGSNGRATGFPRDHGERINDTPRREGFRARELNASGPQTPDSHPLPAGQRVVISGEYVRGIASCRAPS